MGWIANTDRWYVPFFVDIYLIIPLLLLSFHFFCIVGFSFKLLRGVHLRRYLSFDFHL